MDETGEIKATGFNNVVDELFDKLEEGKVYFVSKARVNLAKKKFSNLPNDYELSLERTTEIEEVSFNPAYYNFGIHCQSRPVSRHDQRSNGQIQLRSSLWLGGSGKRLDMWYARYYCPINNPFTHFCRQMFWVL